LFKSPEKYSVQHDFVHVAPTPVFARLDGLNDGMFCPVKMLCGVLVLGRIAASDVAADEAHPKVDPRVAYLQTFLAAIRAGLDFFDFLDMLASF
jgi:hypothetical protein